MNWKKKKGMTQAKKMITKTNNTQGAVYAVPAKTQKR